MLGHLSNGRTFKEIENLLEADELYHALVKERPTPSKQAKQFSQEAKNAKLMQDVLGAAFVCNICGSRIDKKSMTLDHIQDKSKGGAADIDNGQWVHPYCNSAKSKIVGNCLLVAPLLENVG